jgi:hypothetical protein
MSQAPNLKPRNERWLNGPNYDYSKLKKEEVIYKVRFIHKYRVLPLHTACNHASARDHVTWNARTVTIGIIPFLCNLNNSSHIYNL